MAKQLGIYSGNVVELRPSLKSVVRVIIGAIPVIGDLFQRYYIFPRLGIACRGVFSSYEEAKSAILESANSDYEVCNENRTFEAEVQRNFEIGYEDYPVLFWLKGLMRPGVRITDLGGSTGRTYYAFSKALELPADAEWLVAELPAAVDMGTRVASARGETRLSFATDYGLHFRPNIFLTMGTLQYLPERLPEILTGLKSLPDHVVINKVPVTSGPAYWTIQGLSVTQVPYYIHNETELVKGIEALGYELVDTCHTLRGIRIPFHAENDVHHYAGYFFRKLQGPSK